MGPDYAAIARGSGRGRKMVSWLRALADAIFGKTRKPDRLDTATRMAMEADFSEQRDPTKSAPDPMPKVDPIDELLRIINEPGNDPPPRRAKVSTISIRRRRREVRR
jgi:hypothetical protein